MARHRTQEGIAPLRVGKSAEGGATTKRPYYYCTISLTNTLHATLRNWDAIKGEDEASKRTLVVCDKQGHIFMAEVLIAFVRRLGKNPLTGEPMALRDIVPVHYYLETTQHDMETTTGTSQFRDTGHPGAVDIVCPITKRSLTSEKVKVALIKTSGNVYAFDTIDELNLKSRNYTDLLSGVPFSPSDDIIILQDPEKWQVETQEPWYVENRINWKELLEEDANGFDQSTLPTDSENSSDRRDRGDTEDSEALKGVIGSLRRSDSQSVDSLTITSAATRKILQEMEALEKKQEKVDVIPTKMMFDKEAEKPSSTSASLTSSVAPVMVKDEKKTLSSKEAQYKRIHDRGHKGYLRMNTSLGALDIELFAHLAPKACENFIVHAKNNYYNNVIFHRIIPKFMAQGGDPSGTGRGGESIWKKNFEDEFHDSLKFNERGLLACANKGSNTNGSQFFITFSPCPHLDNKHTIFGKVIGGLDVLDKLEKTKTGAKDRPLNPPVIESIVVTIDPFEVDLKKEEHKKKKEEHRSTQDQDDSMIGGWFSSPQPKLQELQTGVGKYLSRMGSNPTNAPQSTTSTATTMDRILGQKRKESGTPSTNPVPKRRAFGEFDFSGW